MPAHIPAVLSCSSLYCFLVVLSCFRISWCHCAFIAGLSNTMLHVVSLAFRGVPPQLASVMTLSITGASPSPVSLSLVQLAVAHIDSHSFLVIHIPVSGQQGVVALAFEVMHHASPHPPPRAFVHSGHASCLGSPVLRQCHIWGASCTPSRSTVSSWTRVPAQWANHRASGVLHHVWVLHSPLRRASHRSCFMPVIISSRPSLWVASCPTIPYPAPGTVLLSVLQDPCSTQ